MATTVEGFQAEIERIMWPLWRDGNLVSRRLHTVQDAQQYQREVTDIQAELRGLKQKVDRDAQQLRENPSDARTNDSPHPLRRWFGTRKSATDAKVIDPQQEHNAARSYQLLSDHIDACIQMFERTKLAIDEAIQRGKPQ